MFSSTYRLLLCIVVKNRTTSPLLSWRHNADPTDCLRRAKYYSLHHSNTSTWAPPQDGSSRWKTQIYRVKWIMALIHAMDTPRHQRGSLKNWHMGYGNNSTCKYSSTSGHAPPRFLPPATYFFPTQLHGGHTMDDKKIGLAFIKYSSSPTMW